MLLESRVLLSSNIFHTNFLILLQLQTVIKSHLLMVGASNLAILIFPRSFFFISGICKAIAHNFMKSRSRDGLAAKGLFYLKFIALRDNIKAGADLVRTITSCKTFGNLALS